MLFRSLSRSTGVVIGIAGPWGSGKSSLLNILNEHILATYPQALIVRFDPWLVSGREDLVGKFISEITGTINARPAPSRELSEVSKLFAEYGAQLSPVAEIASGGLTPMIGGALRATQKALSRDSSLHLHRQKLERALGPLMTSDGTFRYSAQEWNGLDALANDDFDEAERVFEKVLSDPDAPQSMRQREIGRAHV